MSRDSLPTDWIRVARRDLADIVVHWTRRAVATPDDISDDLFKDVPVKKAGEVLSEIVAGEMLRGSYGFIKGSFKCVCFTEAPLAEMVSVFALSRMEDRSTSIRYEPYGIGVSKEWLFRLGGRPVIYQADSEYQALPDSMKWRHCRYEPPAIDFTWEREWRIRKDVLKITSDNSLIIVPTREEASKFRVRHLGWDVLSLDLVGLPS